MKRASVVQGNLVFFAAMAIGVASSATASAKVVPAPVEPTGVTTPATPAASVDATALTEKEKALLQKINALKAPRWRSFGACRYDWAGWKLVSGGVRTTSVQCGPATADAPSGATPNASVAVHCDTLKLSARSGEQPWSSWRLPYAASESKDRGGEDLMVASLCANAQPIPKSQPEPPPAATPAAKPEAKPTATPSSKKPTATPAQKSPGTKP